MICIIRKLKKFSLEWKDEPTIGFTHFQPAQPVTVGKRSCLWLNDIIMDFDNIEIQIYNLCARGEKGTTGTSASYLSLFDGDHLKVKVLDELIALELGFDSSYKITGQTYSRKIDTFILQSLSSIGESVHKFATDIRLLQNIGEIKESFGDKQIGSSAMPYKQNPMKCERACSLSRFAITSPINAGFTSAIQWFERTLDDSAIRRIIIPETFLAIDGALNLYLDIVSNLRVDYNKIRENVYLELPIMASENIIMSAVKKGKDRQIVHETIRSCYMDNKLVRSNILEILSKNTNIGLSIEEIREIVNIKNFIGRSAEQVEEFIESDVNQILEEYSYVENIIPDIKV